MNPKTELSKEQLINLLNNAACLADLHAWVPVRFHENYFVLGENSEETPENVPTRRVFYYEDATYEGKFLLTLKEGDGNKQTFHVLSFADENIMDELTKSKE